MATQIGEASVALKFDTKNAASQLKSDVSSAAESAEKTMSAWSVAVGSIAANAFSKAASVVTESLASGVKRLDTIANSKVVFQAMGYAVDDVNKSMDGLTTYLDGLPTSMDSAVQGVQILSASFGGIDAGTRAFKAMNDAGLAFGATSDQVSNAIFQLSQTSLDGPLDAATWNSLRNSGFSPVFAAMAEEAGITVGELKEQFGGNGTKTVGDFLKELEKLDTQGGGAMESLASLARKNTNGIGTAVENVRNRLAKAWAQILDGIGRDKIASAINSVSSSFSKIADQLLGLVNWAKQNKDWLLPLTEGVVVFVAAFAAVGKVVEVVAIVKGLSAAVAALTSPIGLVAVGVAAVAALVVTNWDKIQPILQLACEWVQDNILPAIQAVVDWVKTNIVPVVQNIFSKVGVIVGKIIELIKNVWTAVTEVVGALMPVITPVVDGIVAFIGGAIHAVLGLVDNLLGLIDGLLGAAVWTWKNIISPIVSFVSGVVKSITTVVQGFLTRTQAILTTLVNAWSSAFNNVKNFVSGAVNAIVNFITGIPGRVSGAINNVKNFFVNAFNTARDWVRNTVNNIVGFVTGIPGRVSGAINNVKNTFANAFNSAKNTINGAVNAIVGFVTGIPGRIGGKINEIKNKFVQAFNDIKRVVKEAVDAVVGFVTSIPSRIGDIGGQIGGAISSGVSGAISSAQSAIEGLLSNIPGLATGGYVHATPGGTLAVIGEGGEDEFVIPRSQMIDILTGVATRPLPELKAENMRVDGGGVVVYNTYEINSTLDADDIGRRINNSIRLATL